MRAYMLLQVLDQLGMEGVLILEVPAGTPAAAAALRPTYRDVFGDIVLGDIIVGESAL
jgi:S1-C subfamily serine protease